MMNEDLHEALPLWSLDRRQVCSPGYWPSATGRLRSTASRELRLCSANLPAAH
jgi:hypothetical protein